MKTKQNEITLATKAGPQPAIGRVLLALPEGRVPLNGQPARCLVAGQARGHYCVL